MCLKNQFVVFARLRIVTAAVICTLASCNTEQLPTGATLSISPANRTITIADNSDDQGRCFINRQHYIDQPIVMTMLSADGKPIGDKNVTVYVDYAGNTYPGSTVLALFDDQRGNSNGVIDADNELVSDRDDNIAIVKTDHATGARVLLLRINVSCPFKGDVFAYVDGVTGIATIEVNALTEDES